MLEQLSVEDFLPLLGQKVTVHAGARSGEFEVKEAAVINSPSPRATPAFHVILRAPTDWHLAQGICRLQHPTYGNLDLFAVPIGPDGQGLCYEIIFN
ncbi:MAG: hypothetical protein L0H70_01100 [Xanthomonadales bacterium]|nr:hypothetical protein [Xanthomonadales bacterium]